MKTKPTPRWLTLTAALAVLLAAFSLAACNANTAALTPATNTPLPPPTDPPLEPSTDANTIENPTPAMADDPTEAPDQDTSTTDGTIPMPELGFEPGDPKLKASDLQTFRKDVGQPQLVELFAFW